MICKARAMMVDEEGIGLAMALQGAICFVNEWNIATTCGSYSRYKC